MLWHFSVNDHCVSSVVNFSGFRESLAHELEHVINVYIASAHHILHLCKCSSVILLAVLVGVFC